MFEVTKRSRGRFLTEGNPFDYNIFETWLKSACETSSIICEPYAGTNNLLNFLYKLYPEMIKDKEFCSYDIAPCKDSDNSFPASPIIKANTLLQIPRNDIDIIVTNPPYLAKNSARRRKLDFPFSYIGKGIKQLQDLYQIAMDTCLSQAKYVCMLIPESFITSKYSKSRLQYVISLPGDLFADTEMPVCLALFGPSSCDDYDIYDAKGDKIASYNELLSKHEKILSLPSNKNIKFNRIDGQIGLHGLDNGMEPTIYFCDREKIDEERIKPTSRGLTRIYIPDLKNKSYTEKELIDKANEILSLWRKETNDIFLTAFKGARKDGKYRRRLSYDIANQILVCAMYELETKNQPDRN